MSYNGSSGGTPITPTDGTLYHALAQIPDHRQSRGRSYSLASLLTFAATAMLRGAKSLYAIAQWGRDYNHLAPLLGLTKPRLRGRPGYRTPCVGELHTVLAALDVTRFGAALTGWVRAAGYDDLAERVVHLDGKRLRGSHGHQLPGSTCWRSTAASWGRSWPNRRSPTPTSTRPPRRR